MIDLTQATLVVIGEGTFVDRAFASYFREQGAKRVVVFNEEGLDPTQFHDVVPFFRKNKIDYVVLNSVLSGGIQFNREHPAQLIYDNLRAQQQVIDAAYQSGVQRLVFIGSSCMYAKEATQPLREEMLMSGSLEPTSEAYAMAKLTGMTMVNAYYQQYGFDAVTLIPATMVGGNDHEGDQLHVLAALLHKFKQAKQDSAKQVQVWGTGQARREFIHVDDVARALEVVFLQTDLSRVMNVGVDQDISIQELATLIKNKVGFQGDICFDANKPDGALQKLLDSTRMKALGWKPQISIEHTIDRMLTQE